MAGILIRNYPTTAATFNSDDYGDIDGATSGTRKMLLSVMATRFGVQLAADGMVFGAGSAAAPKLAVGTAGNGIYASAANTLDVTTNGTRAITVTSGQLVGIGVATPAAALHVGTSLTTSPRGIMSAQYSTGTDGARFHMRKARGTATAPTTIVTGDILGKLVATGYDGSNYLEMASVSMEATGTVAATRIPTRLVWATATNAAPSVLTDRLWLSASGNLGVGTSSETGLTGVGGLVVASTTLGTSGASGALIVGGTGAFGKKCFITDGSTGAQLRLEYTAGAVYSDIGVLSTGHLLVTTTGGNRITSTTVNDSSVLARQVEGGLAFDGVGSGHYCQHDLGSIATSDFSWGIEFVCPTVTTGSPYLGVIGSSKTSATGYAFIAYLSGTSLVFQLWGATSGDVRAVALIGFVDTFGGKRVSVVAVRNAGTSSLTVYVNGAAATTVESTSGAFPSWSGSINSVCHTLGNYRNSGTNPLITTIFSSTIFNRALSASEVITLANQGVQEADKWGSLTAKYDSNRAGGFDTGADGWLAGVGLSAVDGNIDGIGGENDWLRLTSDSALSAHLSTKTLSTELVIGKKYRVSYKYYMPVTANTYAKRFVMYEGSTYALDTVSAPVDAVATTRPSFEITLRASTNIRFYLADSSGNLTFTGTSGDLLYVKDITFTEIGSILDAEFPGVGYQVPDRSSNEYHGVVSATGTSWTLAQRRGQVRATTNTLGDKHIFSQVSLPTNAIITSIVGYTTGTPTVKVGNVSAGSQLVASVAMSASTYQSFTLAATTSTTGNVWVNSSTADTINWTITYMIADP